MITPLVSLLLGAAGLVSALPVVEIRSVSSLNQQATAEAQQRDNTATRAFSSVPIVTGDGQCLFIDPLSGDFRENLIPVQVKPCDGSAGQQWDVITSGIHNNVAGQALVVSSLTQGCLTFDPRKAANIQVHIFSCGGRADGSGQVSNSQLFAFSGGAGPLALSPQNTPGSCLDANGNAVDIANCNKADPNQSFTFGGSGAAKGNGVTASAAAAATGDVASSAAPLIACGAPPDTAPAASTAPSTSVASDVVAAVSNPPASTAPPATTAPPAVSTTTTADVKAGTTAAAAAGNAGGIPTFNPTTPVPVSRAGGVLQPSSAAESNHRDDGATRAFSSVSLKSANGQCLFIDPTAGDFRENLIPVNLKDCSGLPNEKFDIITAGAHNNAQNSVLIVSSLMQGCLNFDDRRAAGDTVIMFSCGGRGDGTGQTTSSQLFPFKNGQTSLALAPENSNGKVCLVPNASGRLDQAPCSQDASQLFTIVP